MKLTNMLHVHTVDLLLLKQMVGSKVVGFKGSTSRDLFEYKSVL